MLNSWNRSAGLVWCKVTKSSPLKNDFDVHRRVWLLCNIVLNKGTQYMLVLVLGKISERGIIAIFSPINENCSNTSFFNVYTQREGEQTWGLRGKSVENCNSLRTCCPCHRALQQCYGLAIVQLYLHWLSMLQCYALHSYPWYSAIVYALFVHATLLQCNSLHTSSLCY